MNSTKTRNMVYTALLAAIICILAPISIPAGLVPITLGTLAMYFVAAVAGAKRTAVALCLYILIGCVGIPVFAGFTGGFQRVAGITGGYIVGFLPMSVLTAFLIDQKPDCIWMYPVAMVAGTVLLYVVGTAWFVLQSGRTLAAALAACVLPFLFGDALKIAVASIFAPRLRKVLQRFLTRDH